MLLSLSSRCDVCAVPYGKATLLQLLLILSSYDMEGAPASVEGSLALCALEVSKKKKKKKKKKFNHSDVMCCIAATRFLSR